MATTPSRLPSRPTTPLRRRSESRLSESLHGQHYALNASQLPLDSVLDSSLVELNDGLADLDQNLQHLQLMHESITSFNESFSAFLYGIEMNAWCVEFPEAPTTESFKRERDIPGLQQQQQQQMNERPPATEYQDTYMTTAPVNDDNENGTYSDQPTTTQQMAVPKSRVTRPKHAGTQNSRAPASSSSSSRIPSYSGSSRIPMKSGTRAPSTSRTTSTSTSKSKPTPTTHWR